MPQPLNGGAPRKLKRPGYGFPAAFWTPRPSTIVHTIKTLQKMHAQTHMQPRYAAPVTGPRPGPPGMDIVS